MDTQAEPAKDLCAVWCSALSMLRERVPEPGFRTWLQVTRLRDVGMGKAGIANVVVGVPSSFAAEWLRHHYQGAIIAALRTCLGRPVELTFAVEAPTRSRTIHALNGLPQFAISQGNQPEEPRKTEARHASAGGPVKVEGIRALGAHTPAGVRTGAEPETDCAPVPALNPRYTFDRFMVGMGNQLATALAQRVAEKPGAIYSPLFIYGPRGAGKTHLLQAIGIDAHNCTGARVLYAPAAFFDNPLFASRLTGPGQPDRADLLLVDDLQRIAGAGGREAQRRLAVLLERMLSQRKGVVVTATQPPGSMLVLRDDLRALLQQGAIAAIGLPDVAMKLSVLSNLARRAGRSAEEGALRLITSSRRTLPELVSLWECVIAQRVRAASKVDGPKPTGPITVQDVQAAIAEAGPDVGALCRSHVGPERIIDQVVSYFDLEGSEICSASKERRIMFPRQVAMYLIRELTDSSYTWIARRFTRQDHTTAMNSCSRIEALAETDPEVGQMLLELRQMIFGEHERAIPVEWAS